VAKETKVKRRRETSALCFVRQTLKSGEGASAVELALLLPLLLMIIFGIFAFGSAYSNYLGISNGAREGARMAAVGTYSEATVRQRAYPATPDSITVNYPNGNKRGEPVEVTVIDQYHLEIPFFGTRNIPLRSKVVMRIETG